MLLTVTDVEKNYETPQGPLRVLDGVSLQLGHGETLALTGESGSGKSTLLHLVAALDRADRGDIAIDGTSIVGLADGARAALRRERLGIVFQQFNLIPSLTVADNLAFQARIANRFDTEWQRELTGRLGLEGLGGRYPEELSGGQQQRVAIGRALSGRPDLILADEPTGNLDERTGDEVVGLCLDLVERSGSALLLVTHSARLAGRLGRSIHLSAGKLQ